jgi:hypothetical protein
MSAPGMKTIDTADALVEHMDWLNESGEQVQVAGVDARRVPFLTFMVGPYGETTGYLSWYPWDSEVDVQGAVEECGFCNGQGLLPLTSLSYPLTILVTS